MATRFVLLRNPAAVALALGLPLVALSVLNAASRNVAPDAVTHATTWNEHSGDVAALSDGRVPSADLTAASFGWPGRGILVCEWEQALPLEKVRIYVGDTASSYRLFAYRGGRLDAEGTIREPEGEFLAAVSDTVRLTNQWIEIPFPPQTVADNIEVWAMGSAVFYEIEVLVSDGGDTAVQAASWGHVRARSRAQ